MFIVIGKFAWGRGKTKNAAIRKMRENHPQGAEYIVYETDDNAIIVTYTGNIRTSRAGVTIRAIEKHDPQNKLPELEEINKEFAE